MIIRPAAPADATPIAAFWNPMIRDSAVTFSTEERTPERIAEDIAARGPLFLVAEDGGRVLGFATCFQFRGGPGYRHTMEHTIILAPESWGRGAGRALMEGLAQAAREAGAHSLIAAISAENAPALAFHAALGFAQAGRLPEAGRKFGRWMDLVLMQKML
ncbi:GNAT family N-acetyltransferase [Aquicoccus sp. SCR17]|nr:GNAT family N-acetyltransferase [Carideicomes alvinocaridis]